MRIFWIAFNTFMLSAGLVLLGAACAASSREGTVFLVTYAIGGLGEGVAGLWILRRPPGAERRWKP